MISPPITTVVTGMADLTTPSNSLTGMTDLTTPSNSLSVTVEPILGYSEQIVMARTYGELRLGTGKTDICLQNHTAR